METDRFIQLRRIFDEAVLLPASEWEFHLQRACAGDMSLQAEARELLLAHQERGTTASTGAAAAVQPARMIGHYRILREIGSGGMGVVYLAVRDDGAFRKHVAVKLLKRNHSTHDLIQRFQQERQVLANLDHPNIARILDGGQTPDGLPYHVMDYIEGLPLDRFCDTQTLDLTDRIRLFQQVVTAVSYLHENLVVHRDLKPSNILVTAEGQVKLLDFGIAKMQAPILEAPDLTGPANRLLTPNYASPEQVSGAPISKTSDIYSLGVILYELLTGRLPYADAGSKLTDLPPLPSANIREDLRRTPETTSQLRRRIVGDLDQIVLLCLRRDPRQRYGGAAALGEDLRRFLEGRSVLARKEPVIERTLRFLKRNRLATAVVALVLLSVGLGVWKTIQAQIQTRQIETREAEVKRLLDSLDRNTDVKPSPSTVDGVRKLRRALEKDLAPAWSARPGNTPARQMLLQRTSHYLDSLRDFGTLDAVLAAELAGAYLQLGSLYEPSSQEHALTAYTNAALEMENIPGSDPEHGSNSAQWDFIVARIKKLGGTVPPIPSITIKTTISVDKNPPEPESASGPSPSQDDSSNKEETPNIQADAAPAPDPAQVREVKSRLDFAIAKCKAADETMQGLEADAKKLGQELHPEIKANYERMHRALDSAQDAFTACDLVAARENIKIANECARRVLKDGGR